MKTTINTALFALAIAFTIPAYANVPQQNHFTELDHIANDPARAEDNIQRNAFRHPAETLTFFGIEPQMSVLEVWPSKGWYTEILAPFLKAQGKLTLAQFSKDTDNFRNERNVFWAKISAKLEHYIAENPQRFGQVATLELEPPFLTPQVTDQFDMVLSFRNAHIWNEDGHLHATIETLFNALKPGGVMGMVEHRASRLSDISSSASVGYLDEAYVIAVAQSVGFQLVASSEINANPLDSKNYPKGVYTLPPTLAMGGQDKEYYLAIGESDRMTLKFIKPNE
ncbi:methyltransferase [Rheinheimera salexigens]|uniref:Methyltransferase n=1 Tax=Rheinheimera salexigens TaxID=1628148 RepID=A0A1E7QA10_9GAMM|nr:methyltransferase [Rheinheimera salexigens]